MAEINPKKQNVFSANDPLDIDELASLNDDISPEFIEQLQNQLTQSVNMLDGGSVASTSDDAELFEDVVNPEEQKSETTIASEDENLIKSEIPDPKPLPSAPPSKINIDESIDDNFIKKYKAKINKQQQAKLEEAQITGDQKGASTTGKDISALTNGNIVEKPIVQEHINYNDSLDYLDDNIKYSKYVIYISPENTDFIESLTVKERKNLINKILREQDDIALTKKRFNMIQSLIKHSIIAIITISISIPIIYFAINTSLEASINNYRRSQSMFKTLYREKGKIKTKPKSIPLKLY